MLLDRPYFDSLSGSVTVRFSPIALSPRDKAQLLSFMLKEMGVLEKFREFPGETAYAQRIIDERITFYWEGGGK